MTKPEDDSDPETMAIVAKLKKKDGAGEGDEESEGEGDASEEAKAAAAEDVLQAVRDRDADALKGALVAFMKACDY